MGWARHRRAVAGAFVAGVSLCAAVIGFDLPLHFLLLALAPCPPRFGKALEAAFIQL